MDSSEKEIFPKKQYKQWSSSTGETHQKCQGFTYTGTTLGWTGRLWHFLQNWKQKRLQNMVIIPFMHLQKIHIFWKFGGCSSKIKPAMPISTLNY